MSGEEYSLGKTAPDSEMQNHCGIPFSPEYTFEIDDGLHEACYCPICEHMHVIGYWKGDVT